MAAHQPPSDLWRWVTRQGHDEALVRTFVGTPDTDAVLGGFGMAGGLRERLTAQEAEQRRWEAPPRRFNGPPYQVRVCPLGAWTLVLEEGQALHLLTPDGHGLPDLPAGVAMLRVEWTLTTGLGLSYDPGGGSGTPDVYGDVVGPGTGMFARLADALAIVHGEPSVDDHGRLLTAAADHLGITPVPLVEVLGPLLTVTRPAPLG